jgi:large subunit ribosomal protein L13
MLKTYSTKASEIKREWHLIDASDKVLGRLATQIAGLLMGKHKPIFCRHLDTGDYVVVINAEKIRVTGNKAKQKLYYRHSGYPGGLKSVSLERMMQTHPTRVIEYAVKGMLPQNRLRAKMMTRLRVHVGDVHPYQGQIKDTSVKTEEG